MTAVLRFGNRAVPRALRGRETVDVPDGPAAAEMIDNAVDGAVESAAAGAPRVVVLGSPADLAAVLTRLLRTDRLDVEVAHVQRWWTARRAVSGAAQRVPLIRDETGQVLTGAACWLPPEGADRIHGEAIVDDAVLFDGDSPGIRIEPTPTMPGLRATVIGTRAWVGGRAAQLGTTGARVVRDGVPAPREVRRSTFYRHTQGWLRVP